MDCSPYHNLKDVVYEYLGTLKEGYGLKKKKNSLKTTGLEPQALRLWPRGMRGIFQPTRRLNTESGGWGKGKNGGRGEEGKEARKKVREVWIRGVR